MMIQKFYNLQYPRLHRHVMITCNSYKLASPCNYYIYRVTATAERLGGVWGRDVKFLTVTDLIKGTGHCIDCSCSNFCYGNMAAESSCDRGIDQSVGLIMM